jgi:SAM-dependent methyltransferase
MSNSTERFSDRVENYVKYRPGYPEVLIETLIQKTGIDNTSTVSDIGSGTGIFTQQLLQRNLRVYAVEPNSPMRQAAEQLLANFPEFTSVDASAESTSLASGSIDLITVAQAFHWFNNETTRTEFARVLKPKGQLALIWNQRKTSQPFQQAYDAVLREFSSDYGNVNHMNLDDSDISAFYSRAAMEVFEFDHFQLLNFESLLGRLKSASYCPAEDSQEYHCLTGELEVIFEAHAEQGQIKFEYDTRLYLGSVAL